MFDERACIILDSKRIHAFLDFTIMIYEDANIIKIRWYVMRLRFFFLVTPKIEKWFCHKLVLRKKSSLSSSLLFFLFFLAFLKTSLNFDFDLLKLPSTTITIFIFLPKKTLKLKIELLFCLLIVFMYIINNNDKTKQNKVKLY